MESKKIDILVQENQNMRAEITAMVKNVHNCLFSFLGSLGLFVGILLDLHKNELTFDYNAGILAFLISQVGIIIIIFSINIQADVITKAAYTSYIEKKINDLVGENIIFWDSKIASRQHNKGAFITTLIFLSLSYFLTFLFLTGYCFNKVHNWLFLSIQISEVIIIVFLSIQVNREFDNVSKHIKSIDSKIDKT